MGLVVEAEATKTRMVEAISTVVDAGVVGVVAVTTIPMGEETFMVAAEVEEEEDMAEAVEDMVEAVDMVVHLRLRQWRMRKSTQSTSLVSHLMSQTRT